jgi:hypothetical protein
MVTYTDSAGTLAHISNGWQQPRDKVSVGAAEPDVVGAPEEPAPSAMALPGPELSSMAGMRCAGAEAGEVGAGLWVSCAGTGEGTPGAGAWALCVARAGVPEVVAEELATTALGPTGIVETSTSS